jgi:hypothetical protein
MKDAKATMIVEEPFVRRYDDQVGKKMGVNGWGLG